MLTPGWWKRKKNLGELKKKPPDESRCGLDLSTQDKGPARGTLSPKSRASTNSATVAGCDASTELGNRTAPHYVAVTRLNFPLSVIS
jgi:hypothetical protein